MRFLGEIAVSWGPLFNRLIGMGCLMGQGSSEAPKQCKLLVAHLDLRVRCCGEVTIHMVPEHRNQARAELEASPCQLAFVAESATEEEEVMVWGEGCPS